MKRIVIVLALVASMLGLASPATAGHNQDQHSDNMSLVSATPNATGATNSDLAFWGDRAYAGNYDGFRIFDISDPANPALLTDFRCFGPQNDPIVWENKLLFLAIDRTLAGPDCGSPAVPSADPNGWEGVRIFDVSNPSAPKFIKGVYTDCGAHTITLYPKNPAQLMLYVSSYPLSPGPTCGQIRGPEAGRDPLHGVIQVIRVPVNNPKAAKEVAEPSIVYPGDADNQFNWAEHGLGGLPGIEPAARACHDIAVFVERQLAAGACAEQGQLWRIKPNGIPDTENPIWVFDDVVDETGTTGDPDDPGVVVDFFHSATFSWDGAVVNFIDESFGDGCPPTTPAPGFTGAFPGDTGRMFFVDAATGAFLSHFMADRPNEEGYCSAHMGLPVPTTDGTRLIVNAWYLGGTNVVDFTDPTNPVEVAFYDVAPPGAAGSDNWSAYWYEGPKLGDDSLTIYATDGVHDPPAVQAAGRGFNVFRVDGLSTDVSFDHLNPQTQEQLIDG
jgi:LVIVD repeat